MKATQIEAYLKATLPPLPAGYAAPGERAKPVLPTNCPGCGGPIRADEVEWVETSALPDQAGNVILYGHNNMYTAIFKDLGKLRIGDDISLKTGQRSWEYQVDQLLILPVLGAGAQERAAYQVYLQPTIAPRLTLISCWPPVSNTHRVVVIAYPVQVP